MGLRLIRMYKYVKCGAMLLILLAAGLVGIACCAGEESGGAEAAARLVQRVTPEYAGRVNFRCERGLAAPVLQAAGGKLLVRARDTRECIRAYGYYLRHVARVHFSWNGDCTAGAAFELPEQPIRVPTTLPMNYALNYCTHSYTAMHWSEERWMRELDRFALNGFHYVLITPGLEKVWQGFLQDAGYPAKKAAAYIPNPCYSAWWNMGNLEGAGGPVSPQLIEREAQLGRKLVERLRELGMEPVLQGYVGLLPHDYPGLGGKLVQQGLWCGYQRPAVLRPDAEDFAPLAALWYEHLFRVYGYRAKVFAGDLFHEGGNVKGIDLGKAAAAVQKAMQAASPGSLWFLQAWGHNPLPKLLAGTSVQHTVILALHKDLSPRANVRRDYGGRRYVWCELSNFGGKQGFFGGFDILEQMEGDAGGASGLGIISEGLETNPLYYELFYERLNNRSRIVRDAFLKHYAKVRYNSDSPHILQALHLLAGSVYTPNGQREGGLENIMCARPSLNARQVTTWSNATPYYNEADVLKAGRLMMMAAQETPQLFELSTFRYDLIDICREVLAARARSMLKECKAAYDRKDHRAYRQRSEAFCSLISLAADLLATHEDFLLGAYLAGVDQRSGGDAATRRSLLQLITTWRSENSLLNDYSHRQFSEMLRHYYLPRWQAFFRTTPLDTTALVRQVDNDNNGERATATWQENEAVDAIQRSFPTANIPLLTRPQGDLRPIAAHILQE